VGQIQIQIQFSGAGDNYWLSDFSNSHTSGGMSTTQHERTVFPPDDLADLARFARSLVGLERSEKARLVGPGGSQIEVPDELYDVLRDVVAALSQGMAISIAPLNTMLTTQEAADR
jgi:hypothetical protein